ncbi:MAG: polysaccharide deacetylase family protein [Pseudomonadales bacterium]
MSRITLSFDNGPSAHTTPFVLNQLQERGLSAFFCLIGRQLTSASEHVDLARETLHLGHRVVNHSMTHGLALGDDLSDEHALSEIEEMHQLMSDLLGDWGQNWFRPFGRGGQLGPHIFSRAAVQVLQDLEYSVLLWNCVPRDWEDTQGWVATALRQIEGTAHAVVVLHDLPTGAMKELPRFLDKVDRLGLDFTLDLPPECVPISNGGIAKQQELEKLVADSGHTLGQHR